MHEANTGQVIWITGLSGAGKSTLAYEVANRLRLSDKSVVVLDGDELRNIFDASVSNPQNHGREARKSLAMQYGQICRLIANQGLTVVIATISLFREVHSWNRVNIPSYFEVYIKVPIEELRRRDPKGIYRRFDAGELANVAGLDLSIDEPDAADWIVEFEPNRSVALIADELIQKLNTKKREKYDTKT